MKHGITIFLLLLPLLALNAQARTATKAEEAALRQSMESKLKDPDSAKYRKIKVGGDEDSTICGEVNAKNSFGGYVGYVSFVGFRARLDDGTTVVEVLELDTAESSLARTMCARRGLVAE